jgi:hypothetical protein
MIRNLKVLGLAVVAVLALTAVMASAASAASYTASAYPAIATGTNTKGSEVFTTEGGKVECDSHFRGTLSAASSTLTVTPKYTSCEAFGFLEATVNMESCDYLFHATSTSSTTVDVVCPSGSIKITAGTCKVEIKGQTGLSSVGTTNSGSNVIAKPNVSGIAYTVTQDGFLCPFGGTGNKTGATYTGEVTLSRVVEDIVEGKVVATPTGSISVS